MAINDIVILCILGLFALSGLVGGFIKSSRKIVCAGLGGLAAFYLGNTISKLLIDNVESIRDFAAQNDWCSLLILIGSYAVTFLAVYLIARIIMSQLSNILSSGSFGKFLDKLLGLVFALCLGFIFVDLYCWGLYGVSTMSTDVAKWVIDDTRLSLDGFQTFTKAIIEINLNAIGAVFPGI